MSVYLDNKFLFLLSFSPCFHFFCCTEILAFLATQNSCVNKVHVMLCVMLNTIYKLQKKMVARVSSLADMAYTVFMVFSTPRSETFAAL